MNEHDKLIVDARKHIKDLLESEVPYSSKSMKFVTRLADALEAKDKECHNLRCAHGELRQAVIHHRQIEPLDAVATEEGKPTVEVHVSSDLGNNEGLLFSVPTGEHWEEWKRIANGDMQKLANLLVSNGHAVKLINIGPASTDDDETKEEANE